ncbi:hypothetical protein [Streptomyces sp. IBSBF 3010]|uniref:hypothetical protein n=1 Tax=Streptomyces sp. IBSBF 3010 TaxID=2903526 RepID=UPI002FDC220B
MRSARTLFAAAAVTAVLTITSPSAYAMTVAADQQHGGSSASDHEHDNSDGEWKKDKPHGGMHTGGGALSKTVTKEWKPGDEGGKYSKDDEDKPHGGVHTGGGALAKTVAEEWQPGDEGGKYKDEEKPHGGMHTGGGAMAMTGSGLAAGSLLLLGGAGVAAYRLRRRQASGGAMA